MEKEPLLPYLQVPLPPDNTSRAPPQHLWIPPEDEDENEAITIPSQLRDRLTLGSPSSSLGPDNHPPTYNLHRSISAPATSCFTDPDHPWLALKPTFSSLSMIVRQALILMLIYLFLGVLMYSLNPSHFTGTKTHPVVDGLYFSIISLCTIGLGDIKPKSNAAKLFSVMFVLVGFGFIHILLTGMVSYLFDSNKGRMKMRNGMKVGLAMGVVVLCIGVGTGVVHFVENFGWLDSFYLSVMSVTTVGYGEPAFSSVPGRLFASVWLLVSTLAVACAFLYMAKARIDGRHRRMVKWVLHRDMTVPDFLAADVDNNGYVSKSEFVIYKLKEMGRISEEDILVISNQFYKLDAVNCGKITLADIVSS